MQCIMMKYMVLAPWMAHSLLKFVASNSGERDMFNFLIFPIASLRLLIAQLWITVSRIQTARSRHTINSKSLDFDQVDRERNWDDQIILTALLLYMANMVVPGASHLPWWETKGAATAIILHMGPVEFLYYWLHRALHHHFLYSRYHSHHHASIVTEPVTSVTHPFAEEVMYFLLFAIPLLTIAVTRTASIVSIAGYLTYIDFMNYMGHCNFELVPKRIFDIFPPLKFLMYTPSFHSLHHTQFRTNYSLFMPFYDYIYGTFDKSTDDLYERSLERREEKPDVIYLTHLTTPQSIFHLRLAFASLASKPSNPRIYLWFLQPLAYLSMFLTCIYGATFTVERNRLKKHHLETWVVPRYSFQYVSSCDRDGINRLIEKTIKEGEERGAKVISLGLLNQGDELNGYGEHYVMKNPHLKIKIVDGTSLSVAVILNGIPQGTKDVLLIGNLNKMAYVLSLALCQRGVQVNISNKDLYERLKTRLPAQTYNYLTFSGSYASKVWLVGDNVSELDQIKAQVGVHFIPYSQFPTKIAWKDCFYHSTAAVVVPEGFENLHTCENWLPRRVISAWRAAGIVHALEKWSTHECGDILAGVEKAWRAALHQGFRPFKHALKT